MKKFIRILYLEDQPEDVELVKELLALEYLPTELTWVNGRMGFQSALKDAWDFDLLLVDYSLPDIGGDEALEMARERAPDLPFIFLAGSLGEEKAVECLRQGATDYVLKTNLPRLVPVIRRALEEARQTAARREAEASHARVAALLRATLESTSEGILVVDLAGRVSAYNRKFLSLCGIPEYVMAPMDMDEVIHYLTGQFGDPNVLLDEARLLRTRPDKENSGLLSLQGNRVLQATGRPHTVGEETVGRVLSFREPESREPAVLQTLGAGRQGFADATLAARVVPWYLVEDRIILPESAGSILGLGNLPSDLSDFVALMHPEDAQFFMEALERSRNVSFKARMRRPDGGWQWTRWNVDRGPEGYRGVIMDITEQEWLEARTIQRKRLEGARDFARRVVGRFHDNLKNSLEELRALAVPMDQRQRFEEALRPLQDAARFLVYLRSFAHLGRPASVPVPFNAFVEELLPRAREAAGPGVQIRFQGEGDLPPVPLATAQMEQAFSAILRNAWEAMGRKGTIQVSTGLVYARPYRPGGFPGPMRTRVFLEVRDSGPGIPHGIQNQVFDPFFTTHLEMEHTGLGLAIAKGIVDGHEGSIQLESAPGKGTTIRILLPV